MKGGIDAIYADMSSPMGLERFAPARPARGAMFSARRRAGHNGDTPSPPPVIAESIYYRDEWPGRHDAARPTEA